MKKTSNNIILLVSLSILLLLYLLNAQEVINNIIDYSIIFLTKLFPAAFIFFIMSNLLIDYGFIETIYKYFHINSSKLYVLILSLISGFPSGAKYTKDLLEKKLINTKEANQIIMFSHFPNPLFILGSVTLIINNQLLANKILLSLVISNFIIYFYYRKNNNDINIKTNNIKNFSNNLNNAINNSIQIIILIYGISLFFYLISSILCKYLDFNTYIYVLINGIFDLTNGVYSTTLINNSIIKSIFIIIFISIGSISIHIQIRSIISNTSISYLSFIKGRIIATILSLLIFILLLYFN